MCVLCAYMQCAYIVHTIGNAFSVRIFCAHAQFLVCSAHSAHMYYVCIMCAKYMLHICKFNQKYMQHTCRIFVRVYT